MYHEEHSLLNGHFTHFLIHFIHLYIQSKANFQQTADPFIVFLLGCESSH